MDRRQRWTEAQTRRRRSPTLYDEWLTQAREESTKPQEHELGRAFQTPSPQFPPAPLPRRSSNTAASRYGDTAPTSKPGHASTSTIRPVPHDIAAAARLGDDSPVVSERSPSTFDQRFPPAAPSNVTAAPEAREARERVTTPTSASSPSSGGRLRRNRDWGEPMSPSGSSRKGSEPTPQGTQSPSHRNGMLGHRSSSSSKSNGESHQNHGQAYGSQRPVIADAREVYSTTRPRTRTLDERRGANSPTTLLAKQRNRIGSVHTPSSPDYHGREYLASVPAHMSTPSAPSILSLGSPVQTPSDHLVGRRSISPSSSARSTPSGSLDAALPPASARRILHLMKTLQGRMSGQLMFRRGYTATWTRSYCYIKDDTGTLMYEPKGGEGVHKTLIPDLRGCTIALDMEGDVPFIEVNLPHSTLEVHIKLHSQSDFDSWYAALLCWKPLQPKGSHNNKPPPQPSATVATSPTLADPPSRVASAQQRERADSSRSNRRKSLGSSLKEAPVIKIGKMVFWDTNVSYTNAGISNVPTTPLGYPSTSRPQPLRMQSLGSRRWRRISGQLRENGELKLYSDADNSLVSVVQLSQLSRCAIQRLDPSVLDNEFCIAIYPQYTSGPNASSTVLRPIFLSLETRILYEVWFVLLRAFTIPQLYGPRIPDPGEEEGDDENKQSVEDLLANSTTDMFRMERSLHIRIVEAKMYSPSAMNGQASNEFSGGARSGRAAAEGLPGNQMGHHVEVLLDDETRAKTIVKYEGLTPLWGESFEFADLPAVLSSASVVIKRRRPPDRMQIRSEHETRMLHDAHSFGDEAHGGYTAQTYDVTCGKVEIYLEELEAAKEVEKWWPVVNMRNQRVGEILIRARAEEGVVLMAKDYEPLSGLLLRFSNGLTSRIAHMIPQELKRLSSCLLDIYQVSGRASDWIMALVEEEIDGLHKETPVNRLRYSKRVGSNEPGEGGSSSPAVHNSDRELIVRDMNKTAALEANLLFRGNTLLTKSLDTHMRRVGREYLEEALGAKLREINERDPDCEVDPNRVANAHEVERNWKKLLSLTEQVWTAINASRQRCPVELRFIFRHIRACAEDRYGDFLRSVSYSSVSGFLFLRFYCPAVLNPGLFGLVKEDIKPRARRTFTLIAKSLQTLANMASFGNKEPWMEQMNSFLTIHRESFKSFIDDVCYVPTPITPYSSMFNPGSSNNSSPTYPPMSQLGLQIGLVSAEHHHSYSTPMTIMQRLPPTSREGFPSLPYLIDQARAFADLVQLWLEATTQTAEDNKPGQPSLTASIKKEDGDVFAFHEICTNLHSRTQECLSRAERAERPNSAYSFRWEELIDQLQDKRDESADESANTDPFEHVKDRIASDATLQPPTMQSNITARVAASQLHQQQQQQPDTEDEEADMSTASRSQGFVSSASAQSSFDSRPAVSERRPSAAVAASASSSFTKTLRSSKRHSIHNTPPRQQQLREQLQPHHRNQHHHQQQKQQRGGIPTEPPESPSQSATSASASASAVSSAFSSDTEASTTALPNYERHLRHEVRTPDPGLRQHSQSAASSPQHHKVDRDNRERDRGDKGERRRVKGFVPALRKKRDRERERERERG